MDGGLTPRVNGCLLTIGAGPGGVKPRWRPMTAASCALDIPLPTMLASGAEEAVMGFGTVSIVGVGLIGGSRGLALRARGLADSARAHQT